MMSLLYQPTPLFTGQQGLPFDPTYGYSLDALRAVTAPPHAPADFAEFWRERQEAASLIDPAPTSEPSPFSSRERIISKVSFSTTGGRRLGGWLSLPRRGDVAFGLVVGHGYGGRSAPDPTPLVPEAAILYPCARGFHLSRSNDLPDNSAQHVVHGLRDRDHYVHGGCVEDVWCAASALRALCPELSERLGYAGVSFGGGIGALAMPWDARYAACFLGLPSFGHHPLRLTMPCHGSGEAVRKVHARHPEAVEATLAYHDAATAATFAQMPALIAPARWDPSVPPPGQFAIHNAWVGEKRLFVLNAGHWGYPGEAQEAEKLQEAIREFFREKLG